MKVFISHKKEDTQIALSLAGQLKKNGIDYYLDVLDFSIVRDGKKLTDHIKGRLNDCSDIMVVMSEQTRLSQWVYFEIGMSAQINMPTVTYLQNDVNLPEFLAYWPRLKKLTDIDTYVRTRVCVNEDFNIKYHGKTQFASERKTAELNAFYDELKAKLRG